MELEDGIRLSVQSPACQQYLALRRASITGRFQRGYLTIPLSLFVSEMAQSWEPQDPNQEAAEMPEEGGSYPPLWCSWLTCLMGHPFIGSVTATTSEMSFYL